MEHRCGPIIRFITFDVPAMFPAGGRGRKAEEFCELLSGSGTDYLLWYDVRGPLP